ncbi:MAG: histidinol-phosphate transaminase [Halomonadaceae bacterium]|nr:MAG: histidinol-phosphate transaminase [Halomonadaceae bacterium]
MSRFWNDRVRGLTPYTPGEQPKLENLVKLNTNENPFGPSPQVIAAIKGVLDEGLRLYPDPDGQSLRRAIADWYQVTPQQVFLGNGSDEVLAHIFQGLFQTGQPVLFPDITYSFYPVYCGLYGLEAVTVPLDEGFRIDPAGFRQANGGVIFPNPNAPTGCLLPLAQVEEILQANPHRVVVVDEAYVDFGGESAIALVDRYDNLLVTQTLSKSRSLAGLRVGFAVGHEDLIAGLERVKNSFNSYPLDRLALAGAEAAFADGEYFQYTRNAVIAEREKLELGLQALGFNVLPSAANFLFVRHPEHDGAGLVQGLRQRGVIVRHFNKPRIDQYLRITVGTPEQNISLLDALPLVINEM